LSGAHPDGPIPARAASLIWLMWGFGGILTLSTRIGLSFL
jgi:hypothetical protein